MTSRVVTRKRQALGADDWQPIPTVVVDDYRSPGPRTDGKRVPHDAIPHLCHIEMTYACNERCIFCYNPERAKLGDLSQIDKIVRAVAESKVPHVYLIGGEPSLVPVTKLNEYIDLLSVHSSVTIVTNGLKRLEGISSELACFGVPIHGSDAKTHEFLNQAPGSFSKTLNTIRHYVAEGHDVRCIPVLTGYNFNQLYDIIRIASDLGMESIFVDRYEDGGIGARNSSDYRARFLKPTVVQFRESVTQMLQARADFPILGGRIGFGTAIPYCLDERLITEDLMSNCGVGTTFAAINPRGDFRMCNQSQLVFGNILDEPIDIIWNKSTLDIFRDLSWVTEPCKSCELLLDCTGGCKVDANCSDQFCVDYAARGLSTPTRQYVRRVAHRKPVTDYPTNLRVFRPTRYTKLTTVGDTTFLVTRYQTVRLDETATRICRAILNDPIINENMLLECFEDDADTEQLRLLVSQLIQAEAVEVIGEVPDDHKGSALGEYQPL